MKGIICYYSGSGNTRLACRYLAKKTVNAAFNLCNIVRDGTPDLGAYDCAGFATFTDFWGPSQLMLDFIARLQGGGKPAFVFNTFGFMSGRTLPKLAGTVRGRGFTVIAGFSLHTPENYPPMIARGMGAPEAPSPKELADFDAFIADFDAALGEIARTGATKRRVYRPTTGSAIMPMFSRRKAVKDMGPKSVDEALCNECGVCAKGCPVGAISMGPLPLFDMAACRGCWFCYNHCPTKAIYTKKFRNIGHYPAPNEALRKKLAAD